MHLVKAIATVVRAGPGETYDIGGWNEKTEP
jgi:hypothetical protein